jgi:uncharacterized membrane protein YuzA (DUF378 family)
MRSSRIFLALITLQLCIPAAVYLLVGLYTGRKSGLDYLPQNYLYMAAPHLLVLLFSVHPAFGRTALLRILTLLNVLLIGFQLWILVAVPGRESGLAWVLYFPLAALAVLVCIVTLFVLRQRHPTAQAAKDPSGTLAN